jgi:hypothetical protein
MLYQNFKFPNCWRCGGRFRKTCLLTIKTVTTSDSNHKQFLFQEQILCHLGNRVTNIQRAVDRTSKHKLVMAQHHAQHRAKAEVRYIKGERIGHFAKLVIKVDNREGRMPWDAVL